MAVDLPGHGGSAALHLDLTATSALLGAQFGPEPFDLLGYSLGARCALDFAIARPDLVRRLVLISGTPGLNSDDARVARVARDETLARKVEAEGTSAFLEWWLSQPLFARLSHQVAGVMERRMNEPEGLAASLRLMGTGAMEPLWDRLPTLEIPTLLLAGLQDEKFSALATRMATLLPAATVSLLPGVGHAVHLEAPERAARLVTTWLRELPA